MKNYSSNILNEISQQLRKRFKFRSRKFVSKLSLPLIGWLGMYSFCCLLNLIKWKQITKFFSQYYWLWFIISLIYFKDSLDDGLKTVTINDLHCNNLVLAARLYSHEHQYMEYMVENYLASARERFEQAKNVFLNVFKKCI